MEKVSIIIPTYNRKKFVRTAVKSAVMQTYPKTEVIVVDDNSDYDIADVLKDFKDEITIIENKKNMGASACYNIGIEGCSGDYITVLDDDDIFHPKKIERQIKVFNKIRNIGLVSCPIGIKINEKIFYKPLREDKNYWIRLTFQNRIMATPLIKKDCFLECGVFDKSLVYHEDRDLYYRIGKKFEFSFDRYPSYIIYDPHIYRLTSQIEKICAGKKALYEKHKNDFEDKDKLFSDFHYELAYQYLKFGFYKKFLHHFKKSIEKNPKIINSYLKEYIKIPLGKFKGDYKKINIDGEIKEIFP